MSYTGTVKSCGRDYGFISCDATLAQYGRDVFVNRAVVGDGAYTSISPGMTVKFDFGLDEKGQPQATSLMITGGAAAPQRAPQRQAPPPQFGAVPSAMGAGGPHGLPAGAQPVTLHGVPGYFVPTSTLPGMGAPQQMKRAHPASYGAAPDMGQKRMRPALTPSPASFQAGGAPASNPGLDTNEVAYVGEVKSKPSMKTGYGFLTCVEVETQFPGKDVFLHQKFCPWVEQMDLQVGEIVTFNMKVNERGAPEVTRCIRS